MIYKLRQGFDVFEDNPGLMLIKEFSILDSRQMMFVCLVCDFSRDNPIGTLTGRNRREQAARISGYKFEADGKRLDRNGRDTVLGNKPSVEAGIEEFKKIHYNQRQRSIESTKKQITEIQEFLEGDKRSPLINRAGEIVRNDKGEEVWVTNEKSLKFALEAAPQLPVLHEALEKLEAANRTEEDTKFEGQTFTASDLQFDSEDGGEDDVPAIEKFHAR